VFNHIVSAGSHLSLKRARLQLGEVGVHRCLRQQFKNIEKLLLLQMYQFSQFFGSRLLQVGSGMINSITSYE